MTNDTSISLPDLEDRIAIARDNIRQITEQAAASSGAADEERNASRMFEQQEELDKLIKQRDAMGEEVKRPAREALNRRSSAPPF